MQNRMRRGAMGGYVMSPFGDLGDFGAATQAQPDFLQVILRGVAGAAGGVAGALSAQPYDPSALADQQYLQNMQTQRGITSDPNFPLYVGGGLAALLLIGLVATKR